MSPSALRLAIFLSVVLTIWLLQHLYLGWRLLSLPLLADVAARRTLLWGLAVAFLTYPLGRILFALGWRGVGRGLEYVGAVWMGTLFLLMAGLLATEVITLGGLVLRPWLGHLRTVVCAAALVAAVLAWIGGLRSPRTVELELPLPRLPAASDGLRIVQISDVHLGTLLGSGKLRSVISQVRSLSPDVLVITGDLIDADAGVVEELLPLLEELQAPRGVYAVLGNHELYAGPERSHRLLRNAGYSVLDFAATEVAAGVFVAGVPDLQGAREIGMPLADRLDALLASVPDEAALILLQHSPGNEARAAAAGVDLLLNGHTHGGQIWPFHLLVRASFRHYGGIYRVGEMTQVVCRGTGHWGPPMRLLAPAEIVLITLRSAP